MKRVVSGIATNIGSVIDKALFPDYDHRNFSTRDCVAIFPRIGIILNRIKKAGNTSVTAFFAEIEGLSFASSAELKSKIQRPIVFNPFVVHRIRNLYSVVVVRNPYERVLSAFRDKVGRGDLSGEYYPGFADDSPRGFAKFIAFLDNGGLYMDRHWLPQTELLFAPVRSFSFVGKLESLEDDMTKVLSDIGKNPKLAFGLRKPHGIANHLTGSSSLIGSYYTPSLAKTVYRLYQEDFDAFSYPRYHASI